MEHELYGTDGARLAHCTPVLWPLCKRHGQPSSPNNQKTRLAEDRWPAWWEVEYIHYPLDTLGSRVASFPVSRLFEPSSNPRTDSTMSHIVSFLTPCYFQPEAVLSEPHSVATTTSDVENHVPHSIRPSSAQASTIGRKVLGRLNMHDTSALTSACSSPEVDYADSCASSRPIVTRSPKWQRQFALLHRNHPFQGLDSALRSTESTWSLITQNQHYPTPAPVAKNDRKLPSHERLVGPLLQKQSSSHWFHRLNIFQKFRRPKDDLNMGNGDEGIQPEALACYNEFKATDVELHLKEFNNTSSSPHLGYLEEDSEIPLFAPLHELNEEQLVKLKRDLLQFTDLDASSEDHDLAELLDGYELRHSEPRSGSDSDSDSISLLDGSIDDDFHQGPTQDGHMAESEISAISRAPESSLLPKSIKDSTVSSPSFIAGQVISSGSIQSSRELNLQYTGSNMLLDSVYSLSAFELVGCLHSSHRGTIVHDQGQEHREGYQEFADPEHQPPPGSSIYSPVGSETQCTSGNSGCDGICLNSDTIPAVRSTLQVFDNTDYAATHKYCLLSRYAAGTSDLEVEEPLIPEGIDSPVSSFVIPCPLPRVQGISTCPPKVDGMQQDFPVRMDSLLRQLKDMKITSGVPLSDEEDDV